MDYTPHNEDGTYDDFNEKIVALPRVPRSAAHRAAPRPGANVNRPKPTGRRAAY